MRKYLYLPLLVAYFAVSGVYAQKKSDDSFDQPYLLTQKKYTVAFQPLQLFSWSLRYDFEIRLGEGHGWLQFGPAVYYSLEEESNHPHYYYSGGDYYYTDYWSYGNLREPYSKMRGGGLDVNYKRFVNPARSFYVAAGLSYTHFCIKYWGQYWSHYTENGLEYHEYGLDFQDQYINRIGVNTYFGYQIPTRGAFLFDMFIGLAYRHSISDKDKPAFDENMISYGYTGVAFTTGVRVGFGIR